MTTPETLSWVIGIANPLSAALVGPLLVLLLDADRAGRWQLVGWLILFIGQTTFLAFGLISDLPGFKYAQPAMIVVAGLNFTLWLMHRRNLKTAAIAAETAPSGRHHLDRRTSTEDQETVVAAVTTP
jgi:hypothetical protein